jgi:hypothetical protein
MGQARSFARRFGKTSQAEGSTLEAHPSRDTMSGLDRDAGGSAPWQPELLLPAQMTGAT